MRRIIEDLSLLAEMDAGGAVPMKMEPTEISDIVEQGLTEYSVRFEQKGLTLNHSELIPCSVQGNKDALRMMFFNLLENALRYTDTGSVSVSVGSNAGSYTVSVTDTGIGIPLDSVPFIFDRFYRVDKSRSRASGGSGLGLAIAKAVATAHGGDISVTSQPGVGSKFTVTLPSSNHHNVS
jgi:signal transduction histidine kinase